MILRAQQLAALWFAPIPAVLKSAVIDVLSSIVRSLCTHVPPHPTSRVDLLSSLWTGFVCTIFFRPAVIPPMSALKTAGYPALAAHSSDLSKEPLLAEPPVYYELAVIDRERGDLTHTLALLDLLAAFGDAGRLAPPGAAPFYPQELPSVLRCAVLLTPRPPRGGGGAAADPQAWAAAAAALGLLGGAAAAAADGAAGCAELWDAHPARGAAQAVSGWLLSNGEGLHLRARVTEVRAAARATNARVTARVAGADCTRAPARPRRRGRRAGLPVRGGEGRELGGRAGGNK